MTEQEELEIQEELEQERARAQADQSKKSEEKPRRKPMGLLAAAFLLMLSGSGDLIELFTAGTLGDLVGLFIDFLLIIATLVYAPLRKEWKVIFSGIFLETIPVPFLNVGPWRTATVMWAFLRSRNKNVEGLISMAERFK